MSPFNDFRTVVFSRLPSFIDLQASEFAVTQVVPTARQPIDSQGQPSRLRPSTARFVTSPRIGYASRPKRAIDGKGLSPSKFAALPAATVCYATIKTGHPATICHT